MTWQYDLVEVIARFDPKIVKMCATEAGRKTGSVFRSDYGPDAAFPQASSHAALFNLQSETSSSPKLWETL